MLQKILHRILWMIDAESEDADMGRHPSALNLRGCCSLQVADGCSRSAAHVTVEEGCGLAVHVRVETEPPGPIEHAFKVEDVRLASSER